MLVSPQLRLVIVLELALFAAPPSGVHADEDWVAQMQSSETFRTPPGSARR